MRFFGSTHSPIGASVNSTAFAHHAPVGGEEQVLHQLLRNRGTAAAQVPIFQILIHHLLHLLPIDPVMLEETAILGGDHGVLQIRGDAPSGVHCWRLLLGLVVDPRLDMSLDLHHGDGRIDPAQRHQRRQAEQVGRGNQHRHPGQDGTHPAAFAFSTRSHVTMVQPRKMIRLDRFLAYSESRRLTVCVIAGLLTASIAWVDWKFFNVSIGFLYLFPISPGRAPRSIPGRFC